MTVEELIAKLGFKVTGLGEATKFVRELERIKKAAAGAGKGIKLNFTGNTSGLARIARDFDRASASARKFEQIARRAYRLNFNGRGPSSPGGTSYPGPGGIPGGRRSNSKSQEKWGFSDLVDGLVSVAAVVTGVKALKTFGNLEEAITELGITAGKTAEEMQPALETFRVEAPKLGITAQNMAELAGGFVAAGIDYDTAVKAAVSTAKAGKASYTDLDAATSASIAVIQNLGVKIGDLGKAQDMMIAGGKLGRAEFKEMAGVMPMLASSGAKLGLKDLKGVRDITAMLEVVREGSATTGDAAIHLKDFMEKLSDPVTVKYLKKHAGVNWEKEMKDADKKGQSRPDRALQIIAKYTKGDSFRLGEIMHEQQSRDAANQLLRNLDKYEDFKKQIDSGSAGTTDRDLATVLGTLNNSMDRLSTSFDNFQGRLGQIMSGGAKAGLAIGEGAVTGATGEGQTGAERNATVEKLNRMWGAPPNLSGVFGSYGRGITQAEFEKRFGAGTSRDRLINPGSLGGRMRWKASAPGAVSQNSFGLNGGIGQGGANAEWMQRAVQQTTNNVTNNTNTGNDQRTQSVTIQQTVNGIPAAASGAAQATMKALGSLGPSLVKGAPSETTMTP